MNYDMNQAGMWGNTMVTLVGIIQIPFSLLERTASPVVTPSLCSLIHHSRHRVGFRWGRRRGRWFLGKQDLARMLPFPGGEPSSPGEGKHLCWRRGLRLCRRGSKHVFLAQKQTCVLSYCLSLFPLKLQNLRLCFPTALHPSFPSLGTLSGVGTASNVWHEERGLCSSDVRGTGKTPQILEWSEKQGPTSLCPSS